MAEYPIESRTIEIEKDGDINILNRTTGSIVDTFSFEKNPYYNIAKEGDNFSTIGIGIPLDGTVKISDVPCDGNTVGMSTDYKLTNVGCQGGIDFSERTVQIHLTNAGDIEFYQVPA